MGNSAKTYTFVVRIRVEEPKENERRGVWRGHVTDVMDGEREHVQDLEQVTQFIARRLREMGMDPGGRG